MDKWADYLISAVRFNAAGTHINVVRVHQDMDTTIGEPQSVSRQEVIRNLKATYTYCTILISAEGKWIPGQKVEIITVEGVEYIKTLPDKSKKDNLDNLPEF